MQNTGTYSIGIQLTPRRATITLAGELDIATARHLAGIEALTAGCADIVIDLAGVTFCDSYAYEALAGYCQRTEARNPSGAVGAVNVPPSVTRIMSLLRMPLTMTAAAGTSRPERGASPDVPAALERSTG